MNKNRPQTPVQMGHLLKDQLKKEFNCSRQTVHMALNYFNNSKLAQCIRKRSKDLLIEEAEKIKI